MAVPCTASRSVLLAWLNRGRWNNIIQMIEDIYILKPLFLSIVGFRKNHCYVFLNYAQIINGTTIGISFIINSCSLVLVGSYCKCILLTRVCLVMEETPINVSHQGQDCRHLRFWHRQKLYQNPYPRPRLDHRILHIPHSLCLLLPWNSMLWLPSVIITQ